MHCHRDDSTLLITSPMDITSCLVDTYRISMIPPEYVLVPPPFTRTDPPSSMTSDLDADTLIDAAWQEPDPIVLSGAS